jgi:hypothetical protein
MSMNSLLRCRSFLKFITNHKIMEDQQYLGQWQGFFRYGDVYGEIIGGQEAEFRLFIEQFSEGQFAGRVIDWEGVGAEGAVATVSGFIGDGRIKFTKQYASFQGFDEMGNLHTVPGMPGHSVVYEGSFDARTNSFAGSWKIRMPVGPGGEWEEGVGRGTWRMGQKEGLE